MKAATIPYVAFAKIIITILLFSVFNVQPVLSAPTAPVKLSVDFGTGFDKVDTFQTQDAQVKKFNSFSELAVEIIKVVLAVIAFVAVIAVIWGGVMYVTSLGDEQKSATAKKIIMYAVAGIIIIGISAIVVNVVLGIFFEAP
ncbi:MAG: hypothetical protein Q8P73_00775 [bacterium]|nr:hypothetical protein [bacterium]